MGIAADGATVEFVYALSSRLISGRNMFDRVL